MHKFLIILLLLSNFLQAQQMTEDSLTKLLKNSMYDSVKVNILNKLAKLYMESNPNKGLTYANQSIILSKKNNYTVSLANAHNLKGICYDVLGNYDSSLAYYNKALTIPSNKANMSFLAGVYGNIGLVYWNLDNYQQALINFNKAKQNIEQVNQPILLANILGNTGLVYHDIKDYKQSNYYFEKSISLYHAAKDTIGSISTVINLAINFFETKNYTSCNTLFKKYDKYINQLDDYYKSEFLINKATLAINTQLAVNTEKDIQTVIKLKKDMGHTLGLANALMQYAEFYRVKKEYVKSNAACYDALMLTEELKALKKTEKVYNTLFSNYIMLNKKDSALKYHTLYATTIDTLFAEAKAKSFSREQVAFKTFEKEKENNLLIIENNSIRNRNQLIIVITISIISLLMIIVWFYIRIKKQQNSIKQKELVNQAVFETEQTERERIARDLHDGVGQKLSVVKMQLSMKETNSSITSSLVDEAIQDIRAVSHNLMPTNLSKGLFVALQNLCDEINFASQTLKIHLIISPDAEKIAIDKQHSLLIYRMIQELITNAIKHAKAKNIHINMGCEKNQLNLILKDDGVGFDISQIKHKDGIGIKNIKERVQQLIGSIHVTSDIGKGTTFNVSIPL